LKILKCSNNCGIDQRGVSELNLRELYANNNFKIKNVNHMKETLKILKILYCGQKYKFDQNNISGLNLRELYADNNKKINNINRIKIKYVTARTCFKNDDYNDI